MKSQRFHLGLVAEGNNTQSTVLGLAKLVEELGPIKAPSLSAGRRLSNSLGFGRAVVEYEDLADANLLLIKVPDNAIPRVLGEIAKSSLDVTDLPVVLCESWLPLETLAPLAQRGAQTATVLNLPVAVRDWFAVDGHPRAVRMIRRLLEKSNARCDELSPDGKALLFAADLLLNDFSSVLYFTAQQLLRHSGFSGNALSTIMDEMLQRAARDFLRNSGAKGRSTEYVESSSSIQSQHFGEIERVSPELGGYLMQLGSQLQQLSTAARSIGKQSAETDPICQTQS
jgi:hypothetical protein